MMPYSSENKETWNQAVVNHGADFLQSFQWSEFQKSIGQKVIKQEIAGVPVQIIKYPLPFKQSYLYAPHVFSAKGKAQSKKLEKELQELKIICKQEKSIFLRVDFLREQETESAAEMRQELKEAKFKSAPANYYFSAISQPPFAAHLDIGGSEEQILSNMRYNTRRSIRLAKERGVAVEQLENIKSFFNLLTQTSQRKNVGLHPREHYFKLKQAFGEDLVLLMAYNKKQLLAGAMILFFGEQATYLHAGSLPGSQNQEAPYLILWQAILEAKKRGCKILDLGAVAPEGSQNHPWQSITTFKMGWRPKIVNYLSAYDWVNKPFWYKMYCLRKKFSIFNL